MSIGELENINWRNNAVIIGSMIAAQSYRENIVALTPLKGYERVSFSENKMNLDKFTIFER